MNEWRQIAPGVLVCEYDLDAKFTRGSLAGLAVGVREAIWKHLELFESGDTIRVYVGGNRKNSLDPPLEVAQGDTGQGRAFMAPAELMSALRTVRARHLPAPENSAYPAQLNRNVNARPSLAVTLTKTNGHIVLRRYHRPSA